MGIKTYIIKKKNKIVETIKRRKERGTFKKEVKKAPNTQLENIQAEIERYKVEAKRYHDRILELKQNYLEPENRMNTLDRKNMLAEIKGKGHSEIKYKQSVNEDTRYGPRSYKPTRPTLKELNEKVYTKDNLPQDRELSKYWDEDKKVKQLNIEIRPVVDRARRVNFKIAKLEAMQSILLAKTQLAELEYKKIQKSHMSLIDSIFSKYKNNKIDERGLRDILNRVNIEIEIMKHDKHNEKDISDNFNRIKNRIQEVSGKSQNEYVTKIIKILRA